MLHKALGSRFYSGESHREPTVNPFPLVSEADVSLLAAHSQLCTTAVMSLSYLDQSSHRPSACCLFWVRWGTEEAALHSLQRTATADPRNIARSCCYTTAHTPTFHIAIRADSPSLHHCKILLPSNMCVQHFSGMGTKLWTI